ncbi:MAG: chemotaxis-specific protein-glutamate methyltransferase CheB [Halieaceae bacterium]|jgi:two-component system chemotaxis response regulator CheB|nr:chemotaxis-specific protein-glutamate methyltransferase CheB [Halieaceae bacterium]
MNSRGPGSSADLRALIVDDTLLYRLLVAEAIDKIPGFSVVARAENGRDGLDKVRQFRPDVVLLDLEMPVMDGFELLAHLRRDFPSLPVLIISSLSKTSSKVTLEALQKGAFDFITKPEESDAARSRAFLLQQLTIKLEPLRAKHQQSVARADSIERRIYGDGANGGAERPKSGDEAAARKSPSAPQPLPCGPSELSQSIAEAVVRIRQRRVEVIGIGVSTGGPQALAEIMPMLKIGQLPPICLVQHMPAPFLTAMAEKLDSQCPLSVREARDGDTLERDTVYIAPGGRQMRISKRGLKASIQLREDPAENHCLPAVDYLFRSLAEEFGQLSVGMLLTGMGVDGAAGLLAMKNKGALTIAQSEASCTVYGMPKQAIKLGAADYQLALGNLPQLMQAAGRP